MKKRKYLNFLYLIALFAIVSSCSMAPTMNDGMYRSSRTILLYMTYDESLSASAQNSYNELLQSYLPANQYSDVEDVLLVYTKARDPENKPNVNELIKLSRNAHGVVEREIIREYPEDDSKLEKESLYEVLKYVNQVFPSEINGLIFWTNGTGWLPVQDQHTEVNIADFAEALPLKYDFIIFDASYMGGVEVAYQLKDKTDVILATQTEISPERFPYNLIMEPLFYYQVPYLEEVCRQFYQSNNTTTSPWGSISMIKTFYLDDLANICAKILNENSEAVSTLNEGDIQSYYRYDNHWYYDFAQFYETICKDEKMLDEFNRCLENIVMLKFATSSGLHIKLEHYSGLSTYIPIIKDEQAGVVETFYNTLDWNKKVGVI